MDLSLIAGIAVALIVAVLVLGGVAGFVTMAVNRMLQRRRQNAHCPEAARSAASR